MLDTEEIKKIIQASHKEERLRNWLPAIAIGITVVMQMGGFLWWLSALNTQVAYNREKIVEISKDIEDGAATYLTRQQVDDIVAITETKLAGLQAQLARIEDKLDAINR